MKMYAKSADRTNLLSLLVLPVMLLLGGTPVSADELLMKDGSRLHGKVVKKEDGVLEFKTGFAGVIKVRWAEVSELHADEPVTVMLVNEETSTATTIKNTEQATLLKSDADEPANSIDPGELAFINPDLWRLGEGARWTGRVNIDLKTQRGNTDKDELDTDAELSRRSKHNRYTLRAQFEKDRNDGKVTSENWKADNRFDHFHGKQFYYGGVLGFEHDEFADLDLRTIVGPHVGYQFFETAAMNLSTDIGIVFVDENFIVSPDNNYWALGWHINFDRWLLTDRIQFYHRHTGVQAFEESNNLYINSWTGFRFPIYKGLVASTEAEIEYDGALPDFADKVDKTYRFKLGYQW